jgi:hypothetical protein
MTKQYKCDNCNRSWIHKGHYLKHINRKVKCKPLNELLIENNNNSRNIYLQLLNNISDNNVRLLLDYINEKLLFEIDCVYDKYNELLLQNEHLESELNILKMTMSHNNTINNVHIDNIHTTNTTNTTNINIVAHGKEDISKIDSKYIMNALSKGYMSVPALVNHMHFNEKYPEYQNIYIPNKKEPYAMVYTGTDWELRDRDDSLDNLYNKHSGIIVEKFEEFYDQLPLSAQKKIQRFVDECDDIPVINNIKKDIQLMLYNKRNMVKKQ